MDSEARGQHTILLIEDDPGIATTLTDVLESENYRVVHAASGSAARASVDGTRPDLIILDIMLPDADGLVLCADLKTRVEAPIIICSATNRKRDAVLGFKLGADDFIAKPFNVDELLTRVQASIRRAEASPKQEHAGGSTTSPEGQGQSGQAMPVGTVTGGTTVLSDAGQPRSYRVGELLVDYARRNVRLGDVSVELTPTEYRLVAALASRPEEVLSRQDLAQIVWGYQDASIGRSIDVHLHRLRSKLKEANPHVTPPTILSVRGFGYKITQDTSGPAAAAA